MVVVGIMAAAIAPAVMQQMVDSRVEETRNEARALHEAMLGKAGENRYGFVGDIGRLPNSFQELAQGSSLPPYTTNTFRSVGMGWRGPYINAGVTANDYLTDAFARPYTGAASGQVRSAGPDGVAGNADDIVFPPNAPVVSGHVVVTVKTIISNRTVVDPAGYRVELFYASSGAEASLSDTVGPYSFSNVPMGIHAVRVVKATNPNAGSVVSQDTIAVRAGSTSAAELWF
jgi:type II secretory pathway pseudopilin PulG